MKLNYILFYSLLSLFMSCKSQQVVIVGGDGYGQVEQEQEQIRVTPGTCVFYGEVLAIDGGGIMFGVSSLDGCGPGVTTYPKVGAKLSARFKGEVPCQVGDRVQVKVAEFEKSYSILDVITL
ncbi:hypothetical protein HNR74_003711 [Flammeovirga kamogawensis]|nr:hypothetical protein [Flammeovirga kamogawensis]